MYNDLQVMNDKPEMLWHWDSEEATKSQINEKY